MLVFTVYALLIIDFEKNMLYYFCTQTRTGTRRGRFCFIFRFSYNTISNFEKRFPGEGSKTDWITELGSSKNLQKNKIFNYLFISIYYLILLISSQLDS